MTALNKRYIDKVMLEQVFDSIDTHSLFERLNRETGISIGVFEIGGVLVNGAISPENNRVLRYIVENGHIPSSFISQNVKPEHFETLNGGGNIYFDINDSERNCIYCHLISTPTTDSYSYLCIHFPATVEKALIEYMAEKIFKIISIENKSGAAVRTESGFYENYIAKELLMSDNDIRESFFWEIIGSSFSQGKNSLGPGYMIAELCALDEGGSLFPMIKDLKRHIPNCLCREMQGIIKVIISNIKSPEDHKRCIALLSDFSKAHNLYCGCSSLFDDLSQRKTFKREAHAALKCGSRKFPNGTLFSGAELSGQMLLYGAIKQFGGEVLMLDGIKQLAEYDSRHSTDYVYSLEMYLFYGNKLGDAAKASFIDRNTLKYRIQKISGMLNCELDDPATAKNLYLALEIYKLLEIV